MGPFTLAVVAFALLLRAELRTETPLFDVRFFARRAFTMGVVIASLSMMSIMCLLLYYNLYAQSREGLGLTALQAGASLLPLCVALLTLAISASTLVARVGLRTAITAGMVLVVIGSAALGAATWLAADSSFCRSGCSCWARAWRCPTPSRHGSRFLHSRRDRRGRVRAWSTPAHFLAAASALPSARWPSRSRASLLCRRCSRSPVSSARR